MQGDLGSKKKDQSDFEDSQVSFGARNNMQGDQVVRRKSNLILGIVSVS